MRIGPRRDGRLSSATARSTSARAPTRSSPRSPPRRWACRSARFELVIGDTDLTRDAGKTSASRQTIRLGQRRRLAARAPARQIAALANAAPDAAIRIEGAITARDGAAHHFRSRLPAAGADGVVLHGVGTLDPPTTPHDANGQGVPYATYGFAAQMAEVEVDYDARHGQGARHRCAHDVGRAINPTQVEGQIHGGIAQGLGLALMEEYHPGSTENLHDYLIPTIGDIPPMRSILIEDPEPLGPSGAKGVGEPALIPTAPAISPRCAMPPACACAACRCCRTGCARR